MSTRNNGLHVDPLYKAATRPVMKAGVTFTAFIVNLVFCFEIFIATRNLLWVLLGFPAVHSLMVLLLKYEPRFFELLLLRLATKTTHWWIFGNGKFWHKTSSYSPLPYNLPNKKGLRKMPKQIYLWTPAQNKSGKATESALPPAIARETLPKLIEKPVKSGLTTTPQQVGQKAAA